MESKSVGVLGDFSGRTQADRDAQRIYGGSSNVESFERNKGYFVFQGPAPSYGQRTLYDQQQQQMYQPSKDYAMTSIDGRYANWRMQQPAMRMNRGSTMGVGEEGFIRAPGLYFQQQHTQLGAQSGTQSSSSTQQTTTPMSSRSAELQSLVSSLEEEGAGRATNLHSKLADKSRAQLIMRNEPIYKSKNGSASNNNSDVSARVILSTDGKGFSKLVLSNESFEQQRGPPSQQRAQQSTRQESPVIDRNTGQQVRTEVSTGGPRYDSNQPDERKTVNRPVVDVRLERDNDVSSKLIMGSDDQPKYFDKVSGKLILSAPNDKFSKLVLSTENYGCCGGNYNSNGGRGREDYSSNNPCGYARLSDDPYNPLSYSVKRLPLD